MTLSSPRARERQTRRYWTEDGLAEVVLGVGFVGLAGLLWLSNRAGAAQARLWGVVQAGYILAFAWGSSVMVQRFKWRLTYPRTGYLAYPRQRWRRRVARFIAVAAVLAVVALVGPAAVERAPALYLAALTVGLVGLYVGLAWSQGWARGAGYALVALVSGGAALAWWRLPLLHGWILSGGLHFVALGVAQTLGGGWALGRYLRRYSRPIDEEAL